MKWEDADSGMRKEQDDGMHSEKDREDSKNTALKRIKIDIELEWVWVDGLVRDKDTLLVALDLLKSI